MASKSVTTIPATINRFAATPISAPTKRKVAGYARVSTDSDEQFTSYEAQIDYYTNFIKSREDWVFVSVYTDVDTPYGQNAKRLRAADFRFVHGRFSHPIVYCANS